MNMTLTQSDPSLAAHSRAAPSLTARSATLPGTTGPSRPPIDADNRRVLVYPVNRTSDWWRYIGQNLGWGASTVVTDIRGVGDISVVDDFYAELARLRPQRAPGSSLLDEHQTVDVIARCRLLRWLDPHLARCMVHAMALAFDRVLEQVKPRLVLSFPIDRYVTDVLERLAHARGIRYLELTTSVVPGMSMLLYRGELIQSRQPADPETVRAKVNEIASPTFLPTYVQKKSKFTRAKFVRTLGYFRVRGLAFKLISWFKRDPLNLHYLDAQPFLGHKCRWKDIRVVDLCDAGWRGKMAAFPRERRVLFGLQLFPEASIDYWLRNVELIDHENLVVEAARAFSDQGFMVLVKDHPQQFGFRQTELLDRLRALPHVVIVPYDISGNELLTLAGVNFTCTGTLGLQAALAGLTSVVTESYYAQDQDFLVFRHRSEVAGLAARAAGHQHEAPLHERRERIIGHLLRGSFDGDYYSFMKFNPAQPNPAALQLAQALGRRLDQLVDEGQL